MMIFMTLYNTPAWENLANNCGLPVTSKDTLPEQAAVLLQPVQKLDKLTQWINDTEAAHTIWLGFVQAEYYLAYAQENGSSLETAAARWQKKTEELLAIQRQHRRQIKLFNIHQALAAPDKFCAAISSDIVISPFTPEADESSLALLAACQYVTQNTELKELNTRLQASAAPLCDSEQLNVDIDYVLNIHRTQSRELRAIHEEYDQLLQQVREIQSLLDQSKSRCEELEKNQLNAPDQTEINKQLKETEEERDLILAQLHLVQEQLEEYYLKLQAEQQKTGDEQRGLAREKEQLQSQLQSERQQAIDEQHRLTSKLEAVQQQNKHALLARDKQHAKELEALESQLRKTKARAASSEFNKNQLEKELQAIKSSLVWKTSAPLRAVRRIGKKDDEAAQQLQQQVALLLTSEFFDVDWYLSHYPDVAENGINPAEHYLLFGAAEGRLPSQHFDGNWYWQHYPDVAEAAFNPLLHFIMYGQEEGRNASPKLLGNGGQQEE